MFSNSGYYTIHKYTHRRHTLQLESHFGPFWEHIMTTYKWSSNTTQQHQQSGSLILPTFPTLSPMPVRVDRSAGRAPHCCTPSNRIETLLPPPSFSYILYYLCTQIRSIVLQWPHATTPNGSVPVVSAHAVYTSTQHITHSKVNHTTTWPQQQILCSHITTRVNVKHYSLQPLPLLLLLLLSILLSLQRTTIVLLLL